MELNTCYVGDCRDGLRAMAAAGVRVQTCVTSPPYFGLRDYDIEPVIWGGRKRCEHDWGDELRIHKGGPHGNGVMLDGGRAVVEAQAAVKDRRAGRYCVKCGAWLGSLGLEPDHRSFIKHMVEVFDLVWKVLADDGTLWLNMGDSYANDAGRHLPTTKKSSKTPSAWVNGRHHPPRGVRPSRGLKPKDLCMMPHRLAIALQERGWWVRSDIIWAKKNPMPESVYDRPTKAHEYVFLLAKSERYYYDFEAIKEQGSPDTHARYARGRSDSHKYADGGPYDHGQTIVKGFEHMKMPDGWATGPGAHGTIHPNGREKGARKLAPNDSGIKSNASFDHAMRDMPNTRNKRSVWSISSEAFSEAHFATFPRKLIEPCVLAGSRPGDIVLDPFMGSGTTAQVAEALGRQWLGCELQPAYMPLQESRLRQKALTL